MAGPARLLITDRAWPDSDYERQALAGIGVEVLDAPAHDEATLIDLARDADAIATCWAPVTEAVVRAARKCRLIARLGIGLDNIAVAAATELGIPVTNVPDYCIEEVSEHALALLLACARKIAFYHHQAKTGRYELQAGPPLRRVNGRTLGLLGFGNIGRAVFRKALGLGLNVVAHTRSGDDHGTACRMVSFDTLLAESDFVSLHLPLTAETRHLLGAAEFRRMKPSAYLINTSRGGLLDHAALWEALERNELAGAALDVFEPEPPDLSAPLFCDERVIVTPHAAFLSQESLADLRARVVLQVRDVLAGIRPANVVNPEVYA